MKSKFQTMLYLKLNYKLKENTGKDRKTVVQNDCMAYYESGSV